jgi:ubiquinone/menaquinone biosynthesis C-methylase UbiE
MSSSQIAIAYDRWAESYDVDSNKTRDLESIAFDEKIRGIGKPIATVLELGCGTGKNTLKLAHLASLSMIAMDFSPQMMRIAEQRVQQDAAVRERVRFVQRDLTELTDWSEVQSNSIDLIAESLVLEHLSHAQLCHVATQCARVLRSGGIVYLGEFHPMRQYNGSQATNKAAGEDGGRIVAFVHHLSDFLNAFKAAGLKLIDVDEFFDRLEPPAEEEKAQNDKLIGRGLPRILTLMFEK